MIEDGLELSGREGTSRDKSACSVRENPCGLRAPSRMNPTFMN